MAAGLGFKEFTTGDVLTAADANGYLASQVVMVFASAAARTSAVASPQEGMISFLKDTNSTEYYSGSAWVAIGGSTATGLTLVKTQTIGSAVSTVTVTDAFSSTYENYLITLNGGVASQTSDIAFTLGSTATGYYFFEVFGTLGSSTVTGFAGSNYTSVRDFGQGTVNSLDCNARVFSPNLAKRTSFSSTLIGTNTTAPVAWNNGFVNDNTQYTAFTLAPANGTITGGTIRVYGYQNS